MAFNPANFVKDIAKDVASNLLDKVIGAATSKLPLNLLSSAQSTTQSLFNVGASFDSISAFATQRTDSIVNQGAEVFFGLAGKDPARASAVDIARLRRAGTNDANFLLQEVNPTTKIAAAKRAATQTFIDLPGGSSGGSDRVYLPGDGPDVSNARVDLP
jgi:hypothetical protein